tara:strand:- start:2335 stop:2619 length:285 start_codon:yes stop_codon:yes gene_type:complete
MSELIKAVCWDPAKLEAERTVVMTKDRFKELYQCEFKPMITGCIVIDDPIKLPLERMSDAKRMIIAERFDKAIKSRLNKADSLIIIQSDIQPSI